MSGPDLRITDPREGGGAAGTVRAYVELTKPRIIELLLTTTVPAMILAAGGWPGWWLTLATLFGGTLSAAGANTINQVYDRDIDAIMGRTRSRPLPTHRVSVGGAVGFGIGLGCAGFLWLALTTNLLAASLSTAGLLFYVLVYSVVLKRTTTQNIVIGGAAGAMPVLTGWAAVTGTLALPAWIMFAIVFFWTPPHFWALALRYDADYRRAGVPMLPVVVGAAMTTAHLVRYSFVVFGVTLLLWPVAPMGWFYGLVATGLGLWLVLRAFGVRSDAGTAMRYFGVTNLYLGGVFVGIAVDVLLPGAQLRSGDALATVVLLVASVMVAAGIVAVAWSELATHPERRLVGRLRDTVEVLVPAVGAAVLVALSWLALL